MEAQLTHAFLAFAGARPPDFKEWLPGWMNPYSTTPKKEPTYSAALAADVDLAFQLGLLSQVALVALGPKRLREAGAFQPRKEEANG